MSSPQHDAGASELPLFWEFTAPPAWRQIDFISDLHLAADRPRGFAAFAGHLRHTPADAVFILGDLFDLWVGDDARDAPFEARCTDALADAATRRTIAIMVGNRDFLLGHAMLQACGALALADPTVLIGFGQRVLLSHGDALCLADTAYQQFRAEVRNERWQREFLARPLAQRLEHARMIRQESERRKHDNAHGIFADVDPASAVRWMHEAATPVLVHGHTHCPGSEPMAPGYVRHVLSDWELDDPATRPRAQVLRWSADGFRRLPPAAADD